MPTDILYAIIGILLTIIGYFIVNSLSKVDKIGDLRVSISSLEANMESIYARVVDMTEQAKIIEMDIKAVGKMETQVALLKEAVSKIRDLQKDLEKLEAEVAEIKVAVAVCTSGKCLKKPKDS